MSQSPLARANVASPSASPLLTVAEKAARAVAGNHGGFTLVEMIVSLSVAGVLLMLLLPAVQAARECARRSACSCNMQQLGIAISSYESGYGRLPALVNGYSIHVSLLPWLEQQALVTKFDMAKSALDNVDMSGYWIAGLHCPSDPVCRPVQTNYAANYGTGFWNARGKDGFFVSVDAGASFLTCASISDGMSHTAAMAEISSNTGSNVRCAYPSATTAIDMIDNCFRASGIGLSMGAPWTNGYLSATSYNHILGPNSRSCTNATAIRSGIYSSSSWHPVGVQVLFADGHVEYAHDSIENNVWAAFGSRNGRETLAFDLPF